MSRLGKQAQAEIVLAKLKKRYPRAASQLECEGPWQVLVATVLAAQCTDARVNLVTPGFFRLWPGPRELAEANLADVENAIHSLGCFHTKAKNLIATARIIMRDFHGQVPATMEELVALPGIARKTANIIMFAGHGVNAGMAVDTHVKRISQRLGLTDFTDPDKIEKDLTEIVPQNEWGDLNHRMVWFGREICKARKPLCAKCELAHACRACQEGLTPSSQRENANEPQSSSTQ